MQEEERGKAMVLEGSPHGILQASKNPGRWARRAAGGVQTCHSQSIISNTAAMILPRTGPAIEMQRSVRYRGYGLMSIRYILELAVLSVGDVAKNPVKPLALHSFGPVVGEIVASGW